MKAMEIAELVEKIEMSGTNRKKMLEYLAIPVSTYYHWREVYRKKGLNGLMKRSTRPGKVWNRMLPEEEETILREAKLHPELTPRLIAVKITDNMGFYVGEKTVYRLLKKYNLIFPRPLEEMPAEKEYKKKTTKPDEMWQCDATHMFVSGWGYYKYIPVLDDYSRYALTDELKLDETANTVSDAIEAAREEAKSLGHKLEPPPVLLTDNGPAFISDVLAGYLGAHGIRHIFGRPFHPQTQGKVERFNRTTKSKTVNLIVYCSPDELQAALRDTVKKYNQTPHSSHKNVSPADVYAGRKEEILKRRADLKKLTLERRKAYNLGIKEVKEDV
jgi:transposase InsO family protein